MIRNKLWNSEEKEFEALSVLSNISRFNTRYRIKDESVAAHSFYVAWFAMNICAGLRLNSELTNLAVECALLHDIPEIYINDITYDCKQLIPGLTALLEDYERDVVTKLSDVAGLILFNPKTPEHKLIKTIVKYADTVSVKQYALSEMKLGNTSFKEIYRSAQERIEALGTEVENAFEEYSSTLG